MSRQPRRHPVAARSTTSADDGQRLVRQPPDAEARGPRSARRAAGAGRTSRRPCAASTWTRSSPTSRANGRAPRLRPPAAAPAQAATCRSRTARGSARARRRPARRRRGWCSVVIARAGCHHVAGRRTDEARAAAPPAARRRVDPAAVRFSAQRRPPCASTICLRDRQAEPGVLAEALVRPVGVEALEDLAPTRPARMPGPSSSTTISTSSRSRAAGDPHGAVRRRERARIVDQVVDHLAEPRSRGPAPRSASGRRPRTSSVTWHAVVARHFVRTVTTVLSSLREVDRRRVLPLQLGVEPAGVGDVGDQPVEPPDVVLDHRQQPLRGFPRSWRAAASRPPSAARSAGSSARARRRPRSSRSPRSGCRARWSCRAARRTDGRSRRGGW